MHTLLLFNNHVNHYHVKEYDSAQQRHTDSADSIGVQRSVVLSMAPASAPT